LQNWIDYFVQFGKIDKIIELLRTNKLAISINGSHFLVYLELVLAYFIILDSQNKLGSGILSKL